ncbi:extracellular solute-binding protein [Paraherbaspirillum soli]|uniref:Extracellular solute-binding protein n=1 Tax=Paraherbaspirillum soli TaxID=631222 RepID=A0ABW0MBA4_9BURK
MIRISRRLLECCLVLCGAIAACDASALNVYSVGPANLIRRLADDFRQQTGIPVTVYQGDTGQVLQRLQQESADPQADVVIIGSWRSAAELSAKGALLPNRPAGSEHIPAQYRTPTYVAQGLATLAIVWRVDSGTPRPQDWSDLVAPAFLDRIATVDPANSGSSLDLIAAWEANSGSEVWDLLKKLKQNGMVSAGSNAQAMATVIRGDKAALFAVADHTALEDKAGGAPIEVIFPKSGTIATARPVMILKTTKAPDDAKRFVDFLLSPAGQRRAAAQYIIPARDDVAPIRPPLDAIKLLPTPADGAEKPGRAALLKRFSELFTR